jgi:uncharacterized protein with PQ loop repeat
MGWDNERYPRTKKDTLHLSFISFGISHYGISGFLILGYLSLIWDIPGISQNVKRYPWDIQHLVISLAYLSDIP